MQTSFSHLRSSKVTFKGVVWEVQKEKLERRRQRQVKKKKKKRDQKSQNPIDIAIMAAIEKDQLRHFLDVASSLDNEGPADIRTMYEAGYVFGIPFKDFAANEDTYMDPKENDVVVKIRHLLENFDRASEDEDLSPHLTVWFNSAIRKKLYVPPPSSPSASSAAASVISRLTDDDNDVDVVLDRNPAGTDNLYALYNVTVRFTYLKGLCVSLDHDQVSDVVQQIFKIHDGYDDSIRWAEGYDGVLAGKHLKRFEPTDVDVVNASNDTEDDVYSVHTVSSNLSESALKLMPWAISFIAVKMKKFPGPKIDNVCQHFFKTYGSQGN